VPVSAATVTATAPIRRRPACARGIRRTFLDLVRRSAATADLDDQEWNEADRGGQG
jgi:hypothetical protein